MSSKETKFLLKKKKSSKKKKGQSRCSLNGCNRKLDLTCVNCSACKKKFCFQHLNRHSHGCCSNVKCKVIQEIKESNPKLQVCKVVKI